MTEQVDVLICGGGSAGLCAAVWLARCGISYKILERRDGPLKMGQADGVQTRTVEVFESFGLAEDLLKEAYHVLELAFWAPSEKGGIARTHYAADVEPGISHQPHVILNQARMNALLAEEMERASGSSDIAYGYEVRSVDVDSNSASNAESYCCTVVAEKDGVDQTFRAKYVLGCDGAHSIVRKSLGFKMIGDSTNAVWGVMDVYPRTNFPDIRKKAAISSDAGNLMIIPREGDSLVRFYIEIENATEAKSLTVEDLHESARHIFSPYTMEIADTAWWSVYSIGQRRADYFTKDHRVFLTGDACHTHSPKAGQGMNVSLQDGYNIGWKLAAVLRSQADPRLLETYVSEREKTATELIEFDRNWTKLFSSAYRREHGITPEQFQQQFVEAGRYTAGQATHYNDSMIVSSASSDQPLAKNLPVGERFPSAQVVRFCDARAMQFIRALPADSRWHIIVFAGDMSNKSASEGLKKVASDLEHLVRRFTPPGADDDSVFNIILVLSGKRTDVEQEQIPRVFTPISGKWKMKNLFSTFVDDESYNSGHGHAYSAYGVDPDRGALVVVRPDQCKKLPLQIR
ncbi:FAD binding domain-containing protein [Truncatella angustata]|uniref:FAD binding domain-containing protein n=1 Tax=Truncatella angustata TaxID=152316 RepID=A0A9P8ZW53_9PEZI|nr:FAD binding domain-containing protein [Truncatella angustata]KAH6653280.1 FAD binding domain-containing protein [Truncatella angustata]